ncbi:MAG: tetratricopeptide repeat protein [Chitinophagaceae bacterium]|nr:tetratricopeptide repeat protein [Chitinophagaceae bacterium]
MYDDDDMDEERSPIEELLARFQEIKDGNAIGMMDEDDYERIIEHYFQNNHDTEALLACDIGHTYYPFSSSILVLKAEILTQTQKYGQALKTLDELEQYDQANLGAVLLRADVLLSQAKYEVAAQYLLERSERFDGKEKIEILLELADVYDECEDYEDIYKTLKKVLALEPRNEEALQKVSFWAEFTNQLQDSVALHLQLTQEDPYSTLAWFNLGAAYQGLKDFEKAVDAYEYCVAIDEKFEFAYRNLADAFMRLKQYDNALEVLQKHLEIGKPEDVIFEAMGYCWEKQKNFSLARHYYRQAAKLSPEDDVIFYKIGETYAREHAWEKAIKSYTTALDLNKENATYCLAIGNCLMEMNATNEALLCYLNAVRLKPMVKTTWLALIKGLYIAQLYDEALTQLEVARGNCGHKADFDYLQAAVLIEMGKTKEALLHLENGLSTSLTKLKLFTQLNPDFIKRTNVADLISKYKKK